VTPGQTLSFASKHGIYIAHITTATTAKSPPPTFTAPAPFFAVAEGEVLELVLAVVAVTPDDVVDETGLVTVDMDEVARDAVLVLPDALDTDASAEETDRTVVTTADDAAADVAAAVAVLVLSIANWPE
jgi:hypothetical protein